VTSVEDDDGVVDPGGADGKVARYEYDPYGELENAGDLNPDAEDNPFRFEGFYYDAGVKTYDMLARPYRPDIGRFLTQDRYSSAHQDLLLQADPLTQKSLRVRGRQPGQQRRVRRPRPKHAGWRRQTRRGQEAKAWHHVRV
jgi:RHS repeat-associated protein